MISINLTDDALDSMQRNLEKLPQTNQAAPITVAAGLALIAEAKAHRELVRSLLPLKANQQAQL